MQQYDKLVVMPLLKVVMGFLNLNQVGGLIFPLLELTSTSTRFFGLAASTQEAIEGLFKTELPFFRKFNVENNDGLDPLIWWSINESRLSNVGFLA
jgi:hypothetical protein